MVYVLQISSVLGRLPVVRAGDMGITSKNITHRAAQWRLSFRSRSSKDGQSLCPWTRGRLPHQAHMYFVISWALGWSCDMWIKNFYKVSSKPLSCCNTGVPVCSVKKYVVLCSNVKYCCMMWQSLLLGSFLVILCYQGYIRQYLFQTCNGTNSQERYLC